MANKLPKLGSINASFLSILSDNDGNQVGQTLHTPNAVAYAMANDDRIEKARSGLLDSTYTREQLAANIARPGDCPSFSANWTRS